MTKSQEFGCEESTFNGQRLSFAGLVGRPALQMIGNWQIVEFATYKEYVCSGKLMRSIGTSMVNLLN